MECEQNGQICEEYLVCERINQADERNPEEIVLWGVKALKVSYERCSGLI